MRLVYLCVFGIVFLCAQLIFQGGYNLASKLWKICVLASLALVVAACQNVRPIYDVSDRQFSESAKKLSQQELDDLVISTGLKRGWHFRSISSGELEGQIHVRTHMAVVKVKISQEVFSITYRSSDNLNEKSGNIEHNYNRWIHNLEMDIATAVLKASQN